MTGRYDAVEAEVKEIEGIRIRVATPAALDNVGRLRTRPPGAR
jgi:hypothetical protein